MSLQLPGPRRCGPVLGAISSSRADGDEVGRRALGERSRRWFHAVDRPAHRIHVQVRRARTPTRRAIARRLSGRSGRSPRRRALEVRRLPVALETTTREEAVERRLHDGVGHGLEMSASGVSQVAKRLQRFHPLVGSPAYTPATIDATSRSCTGSGRCGSAGIVLAMRIASAGHLVRCGIGVLAKSKQHGWRVRERIEESRERDDRPDRVQPERERRDDAEVPSPAANRPEQIRIDPRPMPSRT